MLIIDDEVGGCGLRAQDMQVEWAAEELRAIGLNVSVAIKDGDSRRILVEAARKWRADCIFGGPRSFNGAIAAFSTCPSYKGQVFTPGLLSLAEVAPHRPQTESAALRTQWSRRLLRRIGAVIARQQITATALPDS